LVVGTIVTVAASYIHFDSMAMTVGLALLIASVKAGFVALYFMHLIDERKIIYQLLGLTTFFFIGLMAITIWASGDKPMNTVMP
jgi:cytochrome c oxidase subunit 4